MRRLHLSLRAILAAATLLTLIAIAVAVPVLHAHRRWVFDAFTHRGTAYATTFADSVEAWIAGGRTEMVETGARLLRVAGVHYVRVVVDGDVLAAEGPDEPHDIPEEELVARPEASQSTLRRSPGGPLTLDCAVPFRGLWEPAVHGHVRVGLDAVSAGSAVNSVRWIVAVTVSAFLILVWGGALTLVVRSSRRTRPAMSAEAGGERGDRLAVDEARKRVRCDGIPVPLTPKQFALIRLLASDRRRVFSDREIHDVVWPDSPYADAKDVKQCVYLIRKRFAEAGVPVTGLLVNVPGFGYRIEDAPECDPDVT